MWLRVDRLLGEWGIQKDSPAGREQLAGLMEARRRSEGSGQYEPGGWCLGGEGFRQELLAQISEIAGPGHTGEAIRQSAQAKADRILQEELQALQWSLEELEELSRRSKGDAHKIRIAIRLRRETTMTLAWIAQRLHMGTPGHVSCLLYRKGPNLGKGNYANGEESENKLF